MKNKINLNKEKILDLYREDPVEFTKFLITIPKIEILAIYNGEEITCTPITTEEYLAGQFWPGTRASPIPLCEQDIHEIKEYYLPIRYTTGKDSGFVNAHNLSVFIKQMISIKYNSNDLYSSSQDKQVDELEIRLSEMFCEE